MSVVVKAFLMCPILIILRSQIATSSEEYGGRRYLPYVFTEQGIAMLSAVLNSETAINVSIKIMNAFVEMRRFMASNAMLLERISAVELKQLEFQKKTEEKFDEVFEYISDPKTNLSQTDIKNFNAQYPKLEVKMTNAFHDRFMVLDDKTVYHIGASIKDAGKKCFGITLIQDDTMANDLISRLKKNKIIAIK